MANTIAFLLALQISVPNLRSFLLTSTRPSVIRDLEGIADVVILLRECLMRVCLFRLGGSFTGGNDIASIEDVVGTRWTSRVLP